MMGGHRDGVTFWGDRDWLGCHSNKLGGNRVVVRGHINGVIHNNNMWGSHMTGTVRYINM